MAWAKSGSSTQVALAEELVADGLGLRPGLRGFRQREAHRAGHFGVDVVARREPAGAVGGDDHPVAVRGEELPDIVQHAPDRLLGSAQRHIVIRLEGVGHGLAVPAAVEAHQHGRVGFRVVAGDGDIVAESHDGLVVGQSRKDVRTQLVEVGREVAGKVVVAHPVIDQDLVVRTLERALDAVAADQEKDRKQDEI